jgi:hypothetical protein
VALAYVALHAGGPGTGSGAVNADEDAVGVESSSQIAESFKAVRPRCPSPSGAAKSDSATSRGSAAWTERPLSFAVGRPDRHRSHFKVHVHAANDRAQVYSDASHFDTSLRTLGGRCGRCGRTRQVDGAS